MSSTVVCGKYYLLQQVLHVYKYTYIYGRHAQRNAGRTVKVLFALDLVLLSEFMKASGSTDCTESANSCV